MLKRSSKSLIVLVALALMFIFGLWLKFYFNRPTTLSSAKGAAPKTDSRVPSSEQPINREVAQVSSQGNTQGEQPPYGGLTPLVSKYELNHSIAYQGDTWLVSDRYFLINQQEKLAWSEFLTVEPLSTSSSAGQLQDQQVRWTAQLAPNFQQNAAVEKKMREELLPLAYSLATHQPLLLTGKLFLKYTSEVEGEGSDSWWRREIPLMLKEWANAQGQVVPTLSNLESLPAYQEVIPTKPGTLLSLKTFLETQIEQHTAKGEEPQIQVLVDLFILQRPQ